MSGPHTGDEVVVHGALDFVDGTRRLRMIDVLTLIRPAVLESSGVRLSVQLM